MCAGLSREKITFYFSTCFLLSLDEPKLIQ